MCRLFIEISYKKLMWSKGFDFKNLLWFYVWKFSWNFGIEDFGDDFVFMFNILFVSVVDYFIDEFLC